MISFKEFCKLDEGWVSKPSVGTKNSGATDTKHKVGDSVWAKHPTDASKTMAGKVTKIGRTLTTLQHKDGSTATYPHQDVSSDFESLRPNPYKKKNESISEAIKGWKHAHTDIMKSRAAASAASNSVKLHRLKADGKTESGMHGSSKSFGSEEAAHKHVALMKQNNPGKKMHWNKYVDGKHVGVVSTVDESADLDEAETTTKKIRHRS